MSISGTYGLMQQQIADELGDNQALLAPLSDSALTTSPCQNSIQQAIAKWERELFYFNQLSIQTPLNGSYPWQTSLGQEFYSDTTTPQAWTSPNLSTVATIKKMWVLISSNRYTINPRTSQYLADVSVNPAVVGYPTEFAYTAQTGRFYPIPDGQYPIGVLGTQRLSALAQDADTNAWMQDGYDLIRSEAKAILGREVLNDQEVTDAANRSIYGDPENPRSRGYLYALKGETTGRIATSRVRPTYF